MFDCGQERLRSNHLYKKQMCRGELVLIQARQIGFTWIKSSQTQDKLKKNRNIQTLPSSLLPFIKIYDGLSRYLFSGHAITWSNGLSTQLPPFLGVWTQRGALKIRLGRFWPILTRHPHLLQIWSCASTMPISQFRKSKGAPLRWDLITGEESTVVFRIWDESSFVRWHAVPPGPRNRESCSNWRAGFLLKHHAASNS